MGLITHQKDHLYGSWQRNPTVTSCVYKRPTFMLLILLLCTNRNFANISTVNIPAKRKAMLVTITNSLFFQLQSCIKDPERCYLLLIV